MTNNVLNPLKKEIFPQKMENGVSQISTISKDDSKSKTKTVFNSLLMIKRCLVEIAFLYKLSAVVEIVVLLTISMIFVIFYIYETNVNSYSDKNEILKKELFRNKDLTSLSKKFNVLDQTDRVLQIMKHSVNYSLSEGSVSKRSKLVTEYFRGKGKLAKKRLQKRRN